MAVSLLVAEVSRAQGVPAEASRVRFLIVVDTDDHAGATWGLDGKNLKAVLEAGLRKQKLEGRFTIDMVTGSQVNPGYVLSYYDKLPVEADEALVFYFSGHGAYNGAKGHFMQFTHGPLFRKDLLAAMQKYNPRLVVLLTDCCANYAGAPPAVGTLPPTNPNPGGGGATIPDNGADIPDKGVKFSQAALAPEDPVSPPRPPTQRRDVPPAPIPAPPTNPNHPPLPTNPNHPIRPRDEAPPAAATGPVSNVVLKTGDGPVPLQTIINQTDGLVMRHLFYCHTGLVDINGCQQGKASHGTIPWGGSLFTIGFLTLQKDPVSKFDSNHNGLVEWSEFFPYLQTSCDAAGKSVSKGKISQVPSSTQLGQPVLSK
jgi:hypothetical protein